MELLCRRRVRNNSIFKGHMWNYCTEGGCAIIPYSKVICGIIVQKGHMWNYCAEGRVHNNSIFEGHMWTEGG